MKKFVTLLLFAIVSSVFVNAQDCGSYFPLKQGNSFQLSSYNDKDKLTTVSDYNVVSLYNDGEFTVAKLHCTMMDDKGKMQDSTTYTYKCKGSDFYIDMKNFVSQQQMEAYKDMTVTVSGSEMVVPGNLTVGQTLPDGTMHMDIVNSGMPFATMDVDMTNRKVEAQESVTTPAGTYNCYKMSEDYLFKVTTMGFGIPMNMKQIEWYSLGVGMVRSEAYNKSGKLMSYTVLTKIVK